MENSLKILKMEKFNKKETIQMDKWMENSFSTINLEKKYQNANFKMESLHRVWTSGTIKEVGSLGSTEKIKANGMVCALNFLKMEI